jgi:RNA polymerase sigma-70 factor (ECF subfamily)
LDDEELTDILAAAVRGDPTAFAKLWQTLQPPLLRYLRVTVGDAAEDVASETWLQTARALRDFTGTPSSFRAWLYTIARNRAIDERRRTRRRPEEPRDLTEREQPGTIPDAAHEAIQRLETDWALTVIATLPKEQAEAVMLRIVAGLDVAQTAQVLGKRRGAVRISTMRGLRRLAQHAEVRAHRTARRAQLDLQSPRTEAV